MINYFKRQIELWGEEKQNSLKNKKIAIIGCGGLGSSLALALGSSGIGEIDLVDFDTVALHNIHRQIAFSLKDEGEYKSIVTKKLLQNRFDGVNINSFEIGFEEYALKNYKVDLILDATDNLAVRVLIDNFAKSIKTPWIYGSVEEFHGQICFFDKSNFSSFQITDKTPAGIATPIVMNIASFQANLALRYLVNLPIKKDKLYYLFFDNLGEFKLQAFNMPK